MNRKILIIVFTLALIGGLYYFTMGTGGDKQNELLPEDKVSEENGETDEKVVIEGEPDEETIIEEETSEIAIDKEAPNFTLMNLEGEEVSLEDYRGKIVLLNFWATWCKFCDAEMPDLQKLDQENDDLVVLAVDVMEKKEIVEKYIEEGKYEFQVVLDPKGDIAKTYLVSSFPTSYFIDENGILLGGVPGMMTYAQMNQILDSIRDRD